MSILEYEDLGLYVSHSNSGFGITRYEDEACTFGTFQNDPKLEKTRARIDEELFKKVEFYQKGHLNVRTIRQ